MNKPTIPVKLMLFAGLGCALYAGVLAYRSYERGAVLNDLKDAVGAMPMPAARMMPRPLPKLPPQSVSRVAAPAVRRALKRPSAEETVAAAASPVKMKVKAPAPPVIITPARERIAVAAIVRGQVTASGRPVRSGAPLYRGDAIATGPSGSLQVMFVDETVFTLGPNGSLTLEEFAFNPKTDAGKLIVAMHQGRYRFISGRIAHADKNAMKVRFKSGILHVRGTLVDGEADGDDASANNLSDDGGFTLENDDGSTDVTESGFGSSLDGDGAPSGPTSSDDDDSGTPGGDGTGSGLLASLSGAADDAAEDSGDDDSNPGDDDGMTVLDPPEPDLDDDPGPPEILDGVAVWNDIRAIESGRGVYYNNGGFQLTQCAGGQCDEDEPEAYGEIEFSLNIDFGRRTVGGYCEECEDSSYVYVWAVGARVEDEDGEGGDSVGIEDEVTILRRSFRELSGGASFSEVSPSGNMTATISLINVDGEPAAVARAEVLFDDGENIGEGAVEADLDCEDSCEIGEFEGFLDGIADWDEVRAIEDGQGAYYGEGDFTLTQCDGAACDDSWGHIEFSMYVDFGARTVGGEDGYEDESYLLVSAGGSREDAGGDDINVEISDEIEIPVRSFASLIGDAVFSVESESGNLTADIAIINEDGYVADIAEADVRYDDGGNIGQGFVEGLLDCDDGCEAVDPEVS